MTNYKYRPHHTPEYRQTRNEIILRMRNEGYSLQKIGDRFNVTREYIRQILQKEFDITGCIKFVAGQEALHGEYTSFDIAKMFDTPTNTINVWLIKNCIPKPSRLVDKSKNRGLEKKFWKKIDIDKWIQIRLKYLKIQLEKSIKRRMGNPAPYRFDHHRVQELYNILQMAKAGDIKSLTLYKNGIPDEVMQEFNKLIKPVQYTPTDYSKHINMKTTEDYKKMGLFDACKTERIINITNTTMKRYKKAGFLKENEHYIVGEHYHHRTMYYPEKTKQAIIDAGYDQKLADAQKKRWAKRGNK
tara:strand:+ start:198 stop:1097 length:900 start_codon:yes stop_codon:yes gene_type:complete